MDGRSQVRGPDERTREECKYATRSVSRDGHRVNQTEQSSSNPRHRLRVANLVSESCNCIRETLVGRESIGYCSIWEKLLLKRPIPGKL